ncbi:imm11 family protein [Tenacibaculum discolor]|uniref:imm11 family protein n=1 Tax=Tenacibaculum discolor TaxID=361581 RepID=UPI000F5B2B74|nr:DUF1629 domain-containing protein [Tenacibaculum discolor]
MKYYSINWDYDNIDVIGDYPQVTLRKGFNPGPPHGFWEVQHYEFPKFIPELELDLNQKAKPTNYLEDYTSFGMIINENFKEILKQFNLPKYAFYPIKVYHKGELLDYYWFHYIADIWEYINIEKSSLEVYKKFEFEIDKVIPMPSKLSEFKVIKKSLPRQKELMIHKIVFKDNFPKYDVFNLSQLGYPPNLISERLLNTLQEAGMTGFVTIPFDKIVCE